jgi:hypothetical protein
MQDILRKSLLLLTLDNSVLEQHKLSVEQTLGNVDAADVIDVLMGNVRSKEINYLALRASIPIIMQNINKLENDASGAKNKLMNEQEMWDSEETVLQDYKDVCKELYGIDSELVYLCSSSFYQKAYPRSNVLGMSREFKVLVREDSIEEEYSRLLSLGFAPMREEHGAREFVKQYASNYIPLRKEQLICTMSHRFCSPRMAFSNINVNIQEMFARAVDDDVMGCASKVLSPEDQMLFCFAEMYYQQMYENKYTPQQFADITGYIYNNCMDWERVINYINRYDSNRILSYCVLFLNEVHQYLFNENLFEESLIKSIPIGMTRHLYECRSGSLFTDDIVAYHDSEPHELLLGYRHETAFFGDLSSNYHTIEKEEKKRFLDKMAACGIDNYNYDTYGDFSKSK